MPAADVYFATLLKFKASALIITSGKPVVLRFPQGDRFASQIVQHADLVALVEGMASPQARVDLRNTGQAVFPGSYQGQPFTLEVDARGQAWSLTFTPGAARDVGPPALDTPMDMAIERHRYDDDVPPAPPPAPEARPQPARPSVSVPPPQAATAVGGLKPIERLLVKMKEMGASDLHLTATFPPHIRQHGEMKAIPGTSPLGADELMAMLSEITPEKNLKEFGERNDTDFAHSIPGISRFRANMFRDRFGPGAVFRAIPFQILSPEQLGIPRGVLDLCYLTKGLVVVTGPTGSGKSTTLATLIDVVNSNRADHIITIEDPIEFVHEPKKCLINQREVHTHTRSFKDALRAALREDPDIVLVGEMRDLETIAIAVETAETGHLVFGTLHTTTAPSTVDRIIDQFPPDRQEQIRQMLAESLRGVIAQTLCKKVGGGRVAAYEILLGNPAVANLIRERKTFQLFSLMQTGKAQGMVTLNDSLMEHVRKGIVDPKEAWMKAVNKGEFKGMLQREGIKVTLGE